MLAQNCPLKRGNSNSMGNNDPRLGAMPADPRAAILATSDGGEHWQKQANPVTEQLSDIACVRQR